MKSSFCTDIDVSAQTNVLLVDDDQVDQEAVRRALDASTFDCSLTIASNGLEALDILRAPDGIMTMDRPLLILLDLNMPKMNGFEFLSEIRADPELESAVVFVLSTSRRDEDVLRSYEYRVAGFLSKDTIAADFSLLANFLQSYANLVDFPF